MDCSVANVLYYGKPDDLPKRHFLKCGALEVVYENGNLRYISAGGVELIRSLYSAVRDRNWGTIPYAITNEKIVKSNNGFSVSYDARYRNEEIDFVAEYRIEGNDNKIEFSFIGKALKDFLKNRIGFCVLHPLAGVKGRNLKITHPEGTASEINFPEQISPDSPATSIIAMEWKCENSLCRMDFEGDVWEMEDHRNWTDSSYKTYCTPLVIPFPALIRKGEQISQKITFSASVNNISDQLKEEYILTVSNKKAKLPAIGTAPGTGSLSMHECEVLKQIGLKHLRHDLKFSKSDWADLFSVAVENSVKLNVPLELVLHFTENSAVEVTFLQQFLNGKRLDLKCVWFVDEKSRLTNNYLVNAVIEPLRHIFPDVQIGGGTDAYFAEFNRNRFDATLLDFVTYAVCPQVHAFDNDSLIENMAAQADTVESARILYPGKEVFVSPVTLKQRFNVVATGEEPPVPEHQLPPQVDERQMSLFAAGWTLGSLASLCRAGTDAVTYFQATGWRGIIQGEEENPKPHLFAGRMRDIYPIYHLLKFLQKNNSTSVNLCISNYPLKFTGLIIENELERFLVIANHVCEQLKIKLSGIELKSFITLSEDNMAEALKDPAFLDRADWGNYAGEFAEVKPYALFFAKIE